MFDFVGGTRELSTGYIKELHAALLRNQATYTVVDQFGRAFEKPLEKGLYKDAPNSPTRPDGAVHEYCPPEQVASEMDRLVALHKEHEARGILPEVEAAWLHHRFTQIHPFSDGNGRVVRAVATLVFMKSGWFPLIVNRDQWMQYIEALEKADGGDLRLLVAMFVEAQRDALIQATEVAYDVKPVESPHDAIIALRDRLLQRSILPHSALPTATTTANRLFQIAQHRFQVIAEELTREIRDPSVVEMGASAPTADGAAISAVYNRTVSLVIRTGQGATLCLSFRAAGPKFRGFIDVAARLEANDQQPSQVNGGSLQINYEEPLHAAEARFGPWLDRVITEGLMQWRRAL
jgi:fido (protein-threonine AMPylation protein)